MILHRIKTIRQRIHSTNSSKNWRNNNNRCAASITRKNVIRAVLKRLGEWLTRLGQWLVTNDAIDVVVAVVRIATIVTILAMLSSCGAQYHLKRAIAKDPTIVGDTVVRVDTTIVTNEIRLVDTLVVNDTIVREIESNGARAYIQRIHDTIRVDIVCPPDTIRVTAEIPVERIIYEQPPMPLYKRTINILYLILGIIVLAWVYRLTK